MKKCSESVGFTLIELLTVISIIGMLSLIVLAGSGNFRANARDSIRQDDIKQLATAVRLFVDKYGRWPDCTAGMVLEAGRGSIPGGGTCPDEDKLISFLQDSFGTIPVDPKGPGDNDYYYYYDSKYTCDGDSTDSVLVFAANLEDTDSNTSVVCDGSTGGNQGGYTSTADYDGSIDPSQPYVVRLYERPD